jgi:hypothetical protein
LLLVEYTAGPPKKITAYFRNNAALTETVYARIWSKGSRFAHLLIVNHADLSSIPLASWDVDYDCSVEPVSATPPWSLVGADYCSVVGDTIYIDTISPGGTAVCEYGQNVAAFNNAIGWVVNFGHQVVTSAVADARDNILINDGTYSERIMIGSDRIKLETANVEYLMDTTDAMHDYLVTRKGTELKIYVDGVLVITTTVTYATSSKYIHFGDSQNATGKNSRAYWDYIRYFTKGIVTPPYYYLDWTEMHYAKGAVTELLKDIYQVQADLVGASGRFSPPSGILPITVT